MMLRTAADPALDAVDRTVVGLCWRLATAGVIAAFLLLLSHLRDAAAKELQERFPKVTVEYGEPMRFPVEVDPSRERQQEVADEIFARVREMYEGLATRSGERAESRTPDRAQA